MSPRRLGFFAASITASASFFDGIARDPTTAGELNRHSVTRFADIAQRCARSGENLARTFSSRPPSSTSSRAYATTHSRVTPEVRS